MSRLSWRSGSLLFDVETVLRVRVVKSNGEIVVGVFAEPEGCNALEGWMVGTGAGGDRKSVV